jgi:lysyl-tRNA synthetase class 2
LPGATLAERLLTGAPSAPQPVLVASFPHGQSWPEVPGRVVPHRRPRRLAALVVAAAGFLSLVSDLSGPAAHRLKMLRQILPLAVPQAAGALAALGGLGLLMLARGIRRGQRRAYLVCLVTLVAVATLHLVRAGGVAPAIVALAVAAFLWLRRASFRASSDVPPVRGALLRLLGLAVAAVGAGTLHWPSKAPPG